MRLLLSFLFLLFFSPVQAQGLTDLDAARFLQQAAYGPTPAELARTKTMGINAWLTEQFALPETPISSTVKGVDTVRLQYLTRISTASDQLRQRVADALGQFLVVSANKNVYPYDYVPHLQLLSKNAFGNYRTLLGELTRSPAMGQYLDHAARSPDAAGSVNENYARELMQLFTIGTVALNMDGSPTAPVQASYSQTDISQLARALSGWRYATGGGYDATSFAVPLVPAPKLHAPGPKRFLSCDLPGGTVEVDTDAALDCLFNHPNVAPFVSLRLIRSLVMSNPSPAYVERVAKVFANNGDGVRGDLKATIKAILTDSEARNDKVTPTGGRLKDPIYYTVSTLRALGGGFTDKTLVMHIFSNMSQMPLTPNSVFGHYSPLFRLPVTLLPIKSSSPVAPEFQIYSPGEAVTRGNLMWSMINEPPTSTGINLDLSGFINAAGNVTDLVNAVDKALLLGRMSAGLRAIIVSACQPITDNKERAKLALYLAMLSGEHAVQY
jgi:uncharacterized protein (DUF1800 family)